MQQVAMQQVSPEELREFATRLAVLTDVLEERSQQAVHQVSQSSDQLQQTARGLGLEGQRLAADTVHTIGTQAHDALKQGLQQAVDHCNTQLQHATQQALQTARQLKEQGAALERAQRSLLWKGTLALLVGTVLAAGGSGYVAWKSWQATQQAEFSSAIVEATRSGLLTQCDGVLCVKAGKSAARFTKNGEYILLKE